MGGNNCLTSSNITEKCKLPEKVCQSINCPSLKRRDIPVEKRTQEEIPEGTARVLGDWGADVVS